MKRDERFIGIVEKYLARQDKRAIWLAQRLHIAPSTVTRWLNGETKPRDSQHFRDMIDILDIREKADKEYMLALARYSSPQIDIVPLPSSGTSDDGDPPITTSNIEFVSHWERILNQLQNVRVRIRQEGRWELKTAFLLRTGVAQITPQRILMVLWPLGCWWLTYRLISPILSWPHIPIQLEASVTFCTATLLIPLLVALYLTFDATVYSAKPRVHNHKIFLLQFTGALVGFTTVCLCILAANVLLSYFSISPVPEGKGWGLLLAPLSASYVIARMVPLMRQQRGTQGDGDQEIETQERYETQLCGVDWMIMISFLFVGPLIALFIVHEQEMLRERLFGTIFFTVFIGWMLWEVKQKKPNSIPDWVVILVWGSIVPGAVLFMPLMIPSTLTLHNVHLGDLLLFSGHIIGQCLLTATLYVKGQAQTLWPVLVFFLILELLTVLVFLYNILWGLYFMVALGLLFLTILLLSQKGLRKYLWIHKSYWVMQLVFMASLTAWISFLGWVSILFFMVATAVLVGWAARLQPPLSSEFKSST